MNVAYANGRDAAAAKARAQPVAQRENLCLAPTIRVRHDQAGRDDLQDALGREQNREAPLESIQNGVDRRFRVERIDEHHREAIRHDQQLHEIAKPLALRERYANLANEGVARKDEERSPRPRLLAEAQPEAVYGRTTSALPVVNLLVRHCLCASTGLVPKRGADTALWKGALPADDSIWILELAGVS